MRLYFNQPAPDGEVPIPVSGSIPLHGMNAQSERSRVVPQALAQPSHDAYLAIIDEAEARLAALTAAARAIVADCRVPRGDYLGDMCRWCENTIDRDGHRPGCPVGILAALLEDA
jgi:hypothetical protein